MKTLKKVLKNLKNIKVGEPKTSLSMDSLLISISPPATSTWIKPPELAHVAFKSQGSVRRAASSERSRATPGGGGGHRAVAGGGGGQLAGGGVGRAGGGRQEQAGGAVGKSGGEPQTLHTAQMFYR